MTCTIPENWLTAYHDNELDAARRRQLEAHLAECAGCRDKLARLQTLSAVLAIDEPDAARLASAPAFWAALQPRLPARPAAAVGLAGWLPGIALVILNGMVQIIGGLCLFALMLARHAELAQVSNIIIGLFAGWSSRLLPDPWNIVGTFLYFTYLSLCLAVLYLAWLGYTWRYRCLWGNC